MDHVTTAAQAYDATAHVYARLVGTEVTSAFEAPLDRALLAAFAETASAPGVGVVADVGCGPGRIAAFLAARGVDVVGFDVSRTMIDVARRTHPTIRFQEGRLDSLAVPDHSFGGAVCWYSIIHTPPSHLPDAFREMARVVVPGGDVLVAFQAGDGDAVHRSDIDGHVVSLTSYRHAPDDVATSLSECGFHVRATAVREPELEHESTPQAFLLARTGH